MHLGEYSTGIELMRVLNYSLVKPATLQLIPKIKMIKPN